MRARTEGNVERLLVGLREAHPDAACALTHENPFQLLVATILSAQCTDARVNQVTPILFAKYPDPLAMSRAPQSDLEEIVRTTGFFRNKAKAIRGASQRIVEAYGGDVPRSMEELLSLSGVARKTANVVLGVGHGIAEGVVVDTRVARLSRRLGLTRKGDPVEIERDLMALLPREAWIEFAHLLIFHGRRVCVARKPRCEACTIFDLCPSGPYYLAGRVPPWMKGAEAGGSAKKAARPHAARRGAAKKTAAKTAAKKTAARKPAPTPLRTRRRAS